MNKQIKALAIVEKINDEFTDRQIDFEEKELYNLYYPLSFQSNGTSYGIDFMGQMIWDSENFKYYDDNDMEIDLEKFIRGEIKNLIDNMGRHINHL